MSAAPIVINFLIESATCASPGANIWPGGWDSPSGRQTRAFLQNNGLVGADCAITPRGSAWLDAVLSVPLPSVETGDQS